MSVKTKFLENVFTCFSKAIIKKRLQFSLFSKLLTNAGYCISEKTFQNKNFVDSNVSEGSAVLTTPSSTRTSPSKVGTGVWMIQYLPYRPLLLLKAPLHQKDVSEVKLRHKSIKFKNCFCHSTRSYHKLNVFC